MFFSSAASVSSPLFWLCLAVSLWPILLVSVLLHEAGHALAGKLAGYDVAAWGLGTGEPLLVLPPVSRPAKTRFFLCRRQLLSGLTGAVFPGLFPERRQVAMLLLGGAATNFLLALLGASLIPKASGIGYPLSVAWVGVNVLLCLMALVPAQSRLTDGKQLLSLTSPRGTRLRAPAPEAVLTHAPLWRAVGATTVAQFDMLSLAAALLELGATEKAAVYLQDTASSTSPSLAAYTALVEGLRQDVLGNTGEADRYFAQAQAWYESQGHSAASCLAQIYSAGTDLTRLTALYTSSLVERVPALRTLVTYRLLLAVCTRSTPDSALLATALSRYQSARLVWRSDVQDAIAFTRAAQALQQAGDATGAEPVQKQAQVAIGQVRFALAYHAAVFDAFRQRFEAYTVPSHRGM